MKIDLENLVFNELEEAEKRNAARLEEADKKIKIITTDNDCGDTCKI